MTLKKRVVHDCEPPEVADVAAHYVWDCPECKAEWHYDWGSRWEEPVYKHINWGLGKVQVGTETKERPGRWYVNKENNRKGWEVIDGQA